MFTLEELDAMYRTIQTVHRAERAIEDLVENVVISATSKMEVLHLEARVVEERQKLHKALSVTKEAPAAEKKLE